MDTPSIREAGPQDCDAILPLMREFYAIDGYPFDQAIAADALSSFFTAPAPGHIWLVEHQGRAVGYLALTFCFSFEFHGRNAFVDELYLQPDYRRQGLASELLRLAEWRCRETQVRALHLEVERANHPAQQLYRQVGFQDHDRFLLTKWLERRADGDAAQQRAG